MTVSAILAEKGRDVVTVQITAKIRAAISLLADKKIGAAIVVDKHDKVCGIVSERDIVRELALEGGNLLDATVQSCMTHKVVSCREADTVDDLMDKMTEGKFRHLPVVENGKLSGIISIGDVVKLKIQQAEHDTEEMKRYIAG